MPSTLAVKPKVKKEKYVDLIYDSGVTGKPGAYQGNGPLCLPGERWLPLPGFEDRYEISDFGRGRSIEHTVQQGIATRVIKQKILKLRFRKLDGYVVLKLFRRPQKKHAYEKKVHSLVLLAFVGPAPIGSNGRKLDVCHKNDDKRNNRLDNLEYGTRKKNIEDAFRNGKMGTPKQSLAISRRTRVLTDAQVVGIREQYGNVGITLSSLAKKHQVSIGTIASVVRGREYLK